MNYELTKIVVIGSGNLAEALARAIARSGLELVQLFARNAERAREVAALAGTSWASEPQRLAAADLYLIAVSDRAVAEVAASLPFPKGAAVAHTAGSVALDALPDRIARRAVCYPLQTFTRGREVDFSEIPLFLECCERRDSGGGACGVRERGADLSAGTYRLKERGRGLDNDAVGGKKHCGGLPQEPHGCERPGEECGGQSQQPCGDGDFSAELEAFARRLSRTVIWADSERRRRVHLAGVFACNFANHMYALGERIVRQTGLEFDVLKPLVRETAAKALDAASPVEVQTGPAVRGDAATQARHRELLGGETPGKTLPKTIYETISQSIWETSKKT